MKTLVIFLFLVGMSGPLHVFAQMTVLPEECSVLLCPHEGDPGDF